MAFNKKLEIKYQLQDEETPKTKIVPVQPEWLKEAEIEALTEIKAENPSKSEIDKKVRKNLVRKAMEVSIPSSELEKIDGGIEAGIYKGFERDEPQKTPQPKSRSNGKGMER
ncbi:MAG: hypothetical protein ACM3KR_11260 [Deltaproteobacteria bacterium]